MQALIHFRRTKTLKRNEENALYRGRPCARQLNSRCSFAILPKKHERRNVTATFSFRLPSSNLDVGRIAKRCGTVFPRKGEKVCMSPEYEMSEEGGSSWYEHSPPVRASSMSERFSRSFDIVRAPSGGISRLSSSRSAHRHGSVRASRDNKISEIVDDCTSEHLSP